MWEEYRKEQKESEANKESQIDEAFEAKQQEEMAKDSRIEEESRKEAEVYFAERDKKEAQAKLEAQKARRQQRGASEDPTQKPTKPQKANNPVKIGQLLDGIECKEENGKLVYIISYLNDENKKEEFKVNDVTPHKITEEERKDLAKQIDPAYFVNIDIELLHALGRNDIIAQTDFSKQYLEFVKDLSDGKNKTDDDIKISYNLENLRNVVSMENQDKRFLKRLAKNNQRYRIADYIKPKSLFARLKEKLTRKQLTAGNTPKNMEEQIAADLKEFAQEPGFDVQTYYNQLEAKYGKKLTSEQKEQISIQAKYETLKGGRDFRNQYKVPEKAANREFSKETIEKRTQNKAKAYAREAVKYGEDYAKKSMPSKEDDQR